MGINQGFTPTISNPAIFYIVLFLSAVFLWSSSSLVSITIETASFQGFLYGTANGTAYDNWLSKVVEGLANPNLNIYAPWDRQTNGFGNFVQASSDQITAWQQAVSLFIAGDLAGAQTVIDLNYFPYEVVIFHDTDTDRTYHMLREWVNYDYFDDNGFPDQPEIHQHGSFDFGWGLYVVNPEADNHILINIVHPKDDFITVPIGGLAFKMWNARYFMAAGAGREVLHSGAPINNNSLSDPSRVTVHPFNTAYQLACNEIRSNLQRRELSIQFHSYDLSHTGYKAFQFSTFSDFHGLPMRDLSGNHLDFINATPFVVIPANTIGAHSDVLVTDYYSATTTQQGLFYYYNDQAIPISDNVNLPGFSGNRQSAYTLNDWNIYDVVSPFIHLEMEELPSTFPQNSTFYKWMYGFCQITQGWDSADFYTKIFDYYRPWLNSMSNVLPHLITFDDGLPPTTPENLKITASSAAAVTLQWDVSQSYNFYSYEIYYHTEPFDEVSDELQVINRINFSRLAAQSYNSANVSGLQSETEYFFKIRAVDYTGNASPLSNQVLRYGARVHLNSFNAYGRDGSVNITWRASEQIENQGFNVYRAVSGTTDFILIDSWEDNPSLEGSTGYNVNYSLTDSTAVNNTHYTYRIAWVDNEDQETLLPNQTEGIPRPIYTLTFSNSNGVVSDYVEFGFNDYATDGYDSDYDIVRTGANPQTFVRAVSYHSNWAFSIRNLRRDIYGPFDPQTELKEWVIRASSNFLQQPFTVSISDNFINNLIASTSTTETIHAINSAPQNRLMSGLYLHCLSTGSIVNLTEENMIITFANTSNRTFNLYWGCLPPQVIFTPMENSIYMHNDVVPIAWETAFADEVVSLDLFIAAQDITEEIIGSMPPSTTSYSWSVPDHITLQNARIGVRTIFSDGSSLEHFSSYKLSFWPETHTYSTTPGWHLKANPILYSDLATDTVFSPLSDLFSYDASEQIYINEDTFSFGTGYTLFSPQSNIYTLQRNLYPSLYELQLYQGWNLLPYPFLNSTTINSINVGFLNHTLSFEQAVSLNLLSNYFFSLRDNVYVPTTTFTADEAVWAYCYVPELSITIDPFSDNSEHISPGSVWDVIVWAQHSNELKDCVVLGVSGNISSLPPLDLPKPPPYPGCLIDFCLTNNNHHSTERFYSQYHEPLNDNSIDSRSWDFAIHVNPLLEPISFYWESLNLPANYHLYLDIDGESYEILAGSEVSYSPNTNLVSGRFRITNIADTAIDVPLPVASSVISYPNPFSISNQSRNSGLVTFKYNLSFPGNVQLEIFNIKGQRVSIIDSGHKAKGEHIVFWNGRNSVGKIVSPGIYFYRLSPDNKPSMTGKMLLLP